MAQSDKGVTFSWLPETPTGDGFIWRKYGQKVISNTFIRSYYKCTNANCPARKQIQSSRDGHITELIYTLEHKHLKPPHTSMVASSDNLMEVAVTQSIGSEVNNISPDLKKRKIETPRVVVETTSAVNVVNDGYRWIKYGQKLTKGNPYPRSYYRCFEAGCPVKKHVERASHDEKVVVTTYKGSHDHDMPAGIKTVTQNDLHFAKVPEILKGDGGNYGNHSNGWLNDDDDDDDTVSNDKSGIELVTISSLGRKTRSSSFLDGSPTLKSTNHTSTHEPAAPENSDETVGLWRGNAVGLAAKKLLQAVEDRYPNTFKGVKIRFKSIWLSTLKEFQEAIEGFLKISVDKLSKDQITSLREDLIEFEKFGFDLSWAHKRVDMVEMLRFGNDPLRQELKSSEESLELFKGRLVEKQKLFAEAREILEKAQLMYDNAKDARNNKARKLAEKFGDEYDRVLNGQLGFGMLPGYY